MYLADKSHIYRETKRPYPCPFIFSLKYNPTVQRRDNSTANCVRYDTTTTMGSRATNVRGTHANACHYQISLENITHVHRCSKII